MFPAIKLLIRGFEFILQLKLKMIKFILNPTLITNLQNIIERKSEKRNSESSIFNNKEIMFLAISIGIIKSQYKVQLMQQQKNVSLFDEENQLELSSTSIGIQAILSSKMFSNRASSLYLAPFKTYYDIAHSYEIQTILLIHNPNIAYSLNVSEMWNLLKYKLKLLNSKIKIINNNNDRRVIYFSMIVASTMALNDAKQKVLLNNHEPLRNDLKQMVQKMKSNEYRRRKEILNEFNQSEFFNKEIPRKEKLNLSAEELQNLKDTLLDFKMKDTMLLCMYFQKVLSFVQRCLKQNEQRFRKYEKENIVHAAYSILLLCIYLNIYICYRDWANNIDKNIKMQNFYLSHITERKGFGILHRFLDDAPINVLITEIKQLQKVYFK